MENSFIFDTKSEKSLSYKNKIFNQMKRENFVVNVKY